MGQMNTSDAIADATKRIVEALNPDKIFLFGSHAWGVPTSDSDIDLFVIVRDSNQPSYRRSREAYRSLRGLREPIEVFCGQSQKSRKKSLL